MTKEYILKELKKIKKEYEKEGLIILGLFGSYTTKTDNKNDIDIAYRLDIEKFYKQYNGFKAFSRILDIQKELSDYFNKKVDLCSINQNNKKMVDEISRNLIYV